MYLPSCRIYLPSRRYIPSLPTRSDPPLLPSLPQVIGQLAPIEKELLTKKLEELESCLHPGFNILNWNSLGIPEFIQVAVVWCGGRNSEVHLLPRTAPT